MKKLYRIAALLLLLLLSCKVGVFAQNAAAETLVDQGMDLHDKGQYKEAIQKYTEALKIEPGNITAQIEMAYSYTLSGNNAQSVIILDKLIASTKKPIGEAYNLRGLLYKSANQVDKAIETYKAGIKNDPDNAELYHSLASHYYNIENDAEAEKYIVEAIKRNQKNAGLHRLYAQITLALGKHAQAMLANCNYLLLEPKGISAKVALMDIDKIFTKLATLGTQSTTAKGAYAQAEQLLKKIAVTAGNMSSNVSKEFTREMSLESVILDMGALSQKQKTPKDFFWAFYADYFYSLHQSGSFPAFVKYIMLSTAREKDLTWFKDNPEKVRSFNNWLTTTTRKY